LGDKYGKRNHFILNPKPAGKNGDPPATNSEKTPRKRVPKKRGSTDLTQPEEQMQNPPARERGSTKPSIAKKKGPAPGKVGVRASTA